jgi:plasmid stabilization system protein ParE
MFSYALSPDALQDLQDIWDFVALDNVNAADQLEDEFFEAFEKLARQPRMGHTRPDLTERDVRFWPAGSYLIVYRDLAEVPQIVAVLHGSRDVPEVMRKREYPPD